MFKYSFRNPFQVRKLEIVCLIVSTQTYLTVYSDSYIYLYLLDNKLK